MLQPLRPLAFLFCFLITPTIVHASLYTSKINFQHVLENRDVVLGVVLSLHQDSDGFIWMGGESALIRYDGYEFKTIGEISDGDPSADPKTAGVIPHIFEDSEGTLWVATIRGALRYNKELELLERIPDHQSLKELPLSSVGARTITELNDGRLAVSTFGGVYIVDKQTGAGTLLKGNSGLSPGRVNKIAFGKGALWVGTASGLDRVDPKTLEITNLKPYSVDPDSEPDNGVSAILFAKNGIMWLGTDKGLLNFDPDTGKYERFVHEPENPDSFSGGDIWWLSEDSKGFIWVATDGGGLNMFDPKNKKFAQFKHDPGRSTSLVSNVVRTVIEDSNGDLWVGNYPSGVHFFDRSSAAISSYLPDPSDSLSISHISAMDVAVEQSGNLWVATDGGGLNYFDRKTQTFTAYRHDPMNPNTIGSPAVLSLFLDSQNILWGGTWAGGLFKVDLNNGRKITRVPHDAKRAETKAISTSRKLNNDKVWCIYEDSKGFIWVCTHEGGLSRYDRSTGEFTHYIANGEPRSISDNQVWTVFEDSYGEFWVGTIGGLALLDKETGTFSNFVPDLNNPDSISNPSVLSIFEDSKNRLWLGTNEGLNLFNRESRSFTAYGKAAGFFDDSIRSIVEDPDGNLWMGTNSGVVKFDPETKKVKNYNRESGKLIGGFNYTAAVMTDDGEAIFGGKRGLRIYKTGQMQDNKFLPPVVFTNLRVNSEAVKISPKTGLLDTSINLTEEITLDYKHSIFEINFAALGFRDSGKNQYSYMLEGFDSDWVDAGSERKARYTNLDAGTYNFKVKASNNDGIWNEKEKNVRVVQRPPPWETWWAYTIYGLIILGVVANFIHKQKQKRRLIEQQNRILETKVTERTHEIAEKNKNIQAMLSNMRQGLFTVEPGGLIHPEYSAHLEKIFSTNNIPGHNAIDLLFSNADIGGDDINQISESLHAIIGEDEMNFDFNSHILPTEYRIPKDNHHQYLSLVWDPIIENHIVSKLMVSVRDVTALREAEAEAESQKLELDIISQLINVPAKKYLSFNQSTQQFLDENRKTIEAAEGKSEDLVSLLFRNMHTIKGNCRTYGFKHCSDIVHEVESYYTQLKENPDIEWDRERLINDLARVEQATSEYQKVYHQVLGRGDDARSDDMRVSCHALKSVQSYIKKTFEKYPDVRNSLDMQSANILLDISLSTPLSEAINEVSESLPSIAEQLEKPAPKVIFDDQNLRIRNDVIEVVNNVFAHLLRNSVDHGIESPTERKNHKKSSTGQISVLSEVDNDKMTIRVRDDGRGVNIRQLFAKGVNKGVWLPNQQVSPQEVAELMFASGTSTKESITTISGRGVGMDAVKEFIGGIGGNVTLKLLAERPGENGCIPFETIITLPANYFVEIKLRA